MENKPDPHVERRHHLRPVCQYVLQAIERKRWPSTVTQQMFQALEVHRQISVSKRDPNAGIDGESTVLPGEHVGRGLTAEKPLPAKPPHQPQFCSTALISNATITDRNQQQDQAQPGYMPR